MTIITIEYRRDHRDLRVLADIRLSADKSVLTDKMPKVFVLPVRGYAIGKKEHRKVLDASIGVAFVGSSSVAFATVAILQSYLMSLSFGTGSLPRLRDICDFAQKILVENYRDFGSVWGLASACGLLFFGAMPSDRTLGAFFLRTVIADGKAVVDIEECDFRDNKWYFYGSGAERFGKLVEAEKKKTYAERAGLFDVLLNFIDQGHADVGGSIQAALATPTSVILPQILMPRPDRGDHQVDAMFVGRTHPEFSRIGQCSIGTVAIGPSPSPEVLKQFREHKIKEAQQEAASRQRKKLPRRRSR